MSAKQALVVFVAFLAGAFVGGYWQRQGAFQAVVSDGAQTPAASQSADLGSGVAKSLALKSGARAEAVSGTQAAAGAGRDSDRSQAQFAASKSQPVSVTRPKVEVAILDRDSENHLTELTTASLPAVKQPSQKTNPDGSVDYYGKSEDGTSMYRHLDPRGNLVREGWTSPTGESVHRTYYESGDIKTMTWNRADKSTTTITFTQSGLFESRFDRTADGTTYSTVYDDSGEVKDIYRTKKDGKPEHTYPTSQ